MQVAGEVWCQWHQTLQTAISLPTWMYDAPHAKEEKDGCLTPENEQTEPSLSGSPVTDVEAGPTKVHSRGEKRQRAESISKDSVGRPVVSAPRCSIQDFILRSVAKLDRLVALAPLALDVKVILAPACIFHS